MHGPSLPFARDLFQEKYCQPNESIEESFKRMAQGLCDNDPHRAVLLDIFGNQRFLPGGRIQSAIGSRKDVTAYNCFVSGDIDDSFVDGSGSIMNRLRESATTMRMGGGMGYNFSTLRPRKALIKKLLSHSSGPVSFMETYDANGRTCSSAGHRRGAQMGVLNIDHPDILEFIKCKQPPAEAAVIVELLDEAAEQGMSQRYDRLYAALQKTLRYGGFNISVGLTDEFMRCIAEGRKSFPLRFGGKVYSDINPLELWEMLMQSTWSWAEPGALFLDTINYMNNLWYCEKITATNPCGEQPLPAFGACLLGSFNLVKYVIPAGMGVSRAHFDFDQLREDIAPVVRAMDNVVDRSRYPLREQEAEAHNKRRMGLGVTGMANALEAMGLPYGTKAFTDMEAQILGFIVEECYSASVELAKEKGPFPLFDPEMYCEGHFIRTLSPALRDRIRKHGIRNSHLTSIAPTGTISMAADNVSSSIEPVFAYETQRLVNRAAGQVTEIVPDYGYGTMGVKGRRSNEVSVDEHLAVLSTAQRFVDSSVSKTCNVPPSTPWADFKGIYLRAWELKCKGITTYQTGGRRAGILTSRDSDSCTIDPATGRKNCE